MESIELSTLHCSKTLVCDSLPIPFKNINCLLATDSVLYIAPNGESSLLSLHWDNRKMRSRKLPIEAQSLFGEDNEMFIYSSYNPLIKYNLLNDKYSKINIPDSLDAINVLNFFVKDSAYYFFSNLKGKEEAATIMSLKDKNIKRLGKLTSKYDDAEYRFKSSRHLFSYNNYVLSIGRFIPIIELFEQNGNLKATYDMRKIPAIHKILLEEDLKGRARHFIVRSGNLEGDKLYLLVNDEEKDWGSRSIIEFQMEDSVIARRHYTLTGCERISHFVVKKDTFVVFDHAAAKLKYYPIPY
ncbi:MAG: hypothetical protein IKW32_07360 [Bacteroidaceae bacterium]|nr:hypothetical protein [Bacteroidaceae bacterium]